jgi:hypothetical protein
MAIIMPEKKPSLFGKIAPIAGTILGGIGGAFAGNPVMGAGLGGAAGKAAAGVANKDGMGAVAGVADGVTAGAGAMERRLEELRKKTGVGVV